MVNDVRLLDKQKSTSIEIGTAKRSIKMKGEVIDAVTQNRIVKFTKNKVEILKDGIKVLEGS